MKLGFIGCGKMATALVQGVIKSGLAKPADLTVSDAIPAAVENLAKAAGVNAVGSNPEVAAASDVIVLAVKPGDAVTALKSMSEGSMESTMRWAWKAEDKKLLLSIVAG